MRKSFGVICVVLFVVFAFCVTSIPVQAQQKELKLRYSNMYPLHTPTRK